MSKPRKEPPPRTRSRFDRPDKAAEGDADCGPIYRAVGYSLHRWEQLETQFAAIFAYLISPGRSTHAAWRAYGAIATSRGRKEMIEATAEAFFLNFPDDDLEKRCNTLLKHYFEAGSRRNDIAHGTVEGYSEPVHPFRIHWFLVPPLYATNKTTVTMKKKYAFVSAQINSFADLFVQLEKEASSFAEDLRRHYQTQPQEKTSAY